MKNSLSQLIRTFTLLFLLICFSDRFKAQVGSVLHFDGSDDFVSLGSTALKPTAGLTAEAWINPASWTSTCTMLGNTQASGYAIWMAGGTLYGYVFRNGSYAVVSTTVSGFAAAWYHVALTYDGRYTRLYVDATLMDTDDAGGTYAIQYAANTTYFGAESYTVGSLTPEPGYYYQGQMDEVRIWNYARSQCQIYTFRGCEIATSAPGLLGNYHFNQGIAGGNNILIVLLNDDSGNLNHGSLLFFAKNFGTSNFLTPGPFSNGFTTAAPTPTVTTGQEYSVSIGLANGQTNVSDWAPYVTTFTNPLPGGAVVTGMNLALDGVDQGWGGSGCTAAFYAGGEYIAGFIYSHSWQGFSNSVTKAFPYYNYGGVNTFSMYFCGWPGWQGFMANVSLTIRYTLLNTAPLSVCQNSTVILQGFGASTYTWSGGVINGSPTPVTTSQTYTVTGLVYGCASSNTVQVNAIPAPTINAIVGNTFVCLGSNLTLSMSTTGAVSSYSWTSGASTASISVSPPSGTGYTATATNTSGCSHTATTFITVGSLPTISVNSGSICSGNSFTLNPTGASTFTYSGGSAIVSPASSTSYSVTGTDGLGCVSAAPAISSVTVYTTPTIAVNSGAICSGQSFTIVPTGVLSYTFLTGSTVVTPPISTNYSVIGSSASGCIASNTAVSAVVVNTLPIVSVSTASAATCFGGSITLSGVGANTYTWTGGISNGVAFVPPATGNYSVSGTNTLTGCSSAVSAGITVTVQPLPVISVPNYTLCSGQSVSLTPGGAATYTFSGGAALVSPSVTTNYSVSGTSTAGCISAFPAVSTVTVYTTPTVALNTGSTCAGQSFVLNPSGAFTYTISGGTFTVSPVVNANYSLTGTSVDGCVASNTAVSTITAVALPVVAISSSSTALCLGGSVTLTASNANTYTWNPGGTVSNSIVVSPALSTTYTLSGTSLAGCNSTNAPSQLITVYNPPSLSSSTPSVTICSGNNATLMASGAGTYTWNPGNLSGSSVTVSPASNTSYSVSGTSTAGCLSLLPAFASVTVNTTPTVALSSGTICAGQNIILTPSGASTYTISGGSFTVSPLVNTNYSLTGTSSLNCVSSNTAVVTVTVFALPVVAISTSSNALCSGGSVSLTASNAASYTWTPGGSNATVVAVSPTITSSYTLAGTSTAGCSSTNAPVQTITVYTLPVLSTGTPSTAICLGANVSLSVTGASTYTWNPGSLSGSLIVVSPVSSTAYSVSGKSSFGCASTNTLVSTVTVNSLPNISLSANQNTICFGNSTTLTATGANTYVLIPGNLNGNSFTLSPGANTSYSLSGTNTLTGCTSNTFATLTITVNPLPAVAITTNSQVICFGQSAVLSGSNAATYTWNPGAFVGQNFTVTPAANTTYTLNGTSAAGCTNTNLAIQTITVNPLPVVTASVSPAVVCFGNSLTLSGGGANIYTWSGGAINGQAFAPAASTSYTVNGTNTLTGCTSTNSPVVSITVNALPTVGINSSTTAVCMGFSTMLNGTGASTYTWTGGILNGVAFSPTITNQYTVTGTSVLGCSNTAVQGVTVYNLPVVSATSSSSVICLGDPVTLNGSGADTYTWIPAAPNGSPFNPTSTATYSLVGTQTLSGCSSTNNVTQSIQVNPLPVVGGSASNPVICYGFSTTLTGSGANTYVWSGGVNNGTAFTPSTTSDYTVTGTDLNSCSNTALVTVTVNALPQLTISSSDPNSCEAQTVTLTVSGASTYTWNNSMNTTFIIDTLLLNNSNSTTYTYTVSGRDANNCLNTNTFVQTVSECDSVFAVSLNTVNIVSCRGRADGYIQLETTVGYSVYKTEYFWTSSNATLSCPANDCEKLENLASGEYSVKVKLTYTLNNFHVKSDSLFINSVSLNEDGSDCELVIYNAITVNNDGKNDTWKIKNIDLYPNNKVRLFDRYGKEVGSIDGYNNIDKFWPSSDQEGDLLSTTYFFTLDLGDGSEMKKGWIEVFKN